MSDSEEELAIAEKSLTPLEKEGYSLNHKEKVFPCSTCEMIFWRQFVTIKF